MILTDHRLGLAQIFSNKRIVSTLLSETVDHVSERILAFIGIKVGRSVRAESIRLLLASLPPPICNDLKVDFHLVQVVSMRQVVARLARRVQLWRHKQLKSVKQDQMLHVAFEAFDQTNLFVEFHVALVAAVQLYKLLINLNQILEEIVLALKQLAQVLMCYVLAVMVAVVQVVVCLKRNKFVLNE